MLFPGQEEVIRRVAAVHPDLEADLVEHRDYYEDILPTLFMADVEEWAEARFAAGEKDQVERLLGVLEQLFLEGGEGEELVAVGFIEGLDGPNGPLAGMRLMLGPAMARHYRVIWGDSAIQVPLT